MTGTSPAIALIAVSIVLQLWVAVAALRLIRITGGRAAWIAIALATVLMVFRRIIVLMSLLHGETIRPFGLLEELVAVSTSLLLAFGIYYIRPIFLSIRLSEAEARSGERRYRTLIENLPQKIFLKDRNLVYVSCNTNLARDLKMEPEEFVGKTDYDFFPRELAEKYRADDKRVMDTGQTQDIEELYIQDGQERIVHTVKTPVRDERGEVVGVLGIFWDITEQKQAEEEIKRLNEHLKQQTAELEAANRELEAFSFSVSHDLRAPLRTVDGFSVAVLEDYGEKLDVEGRDYLERIRSAARRMSQLIDDLLKLSRVTRAEMRRERVDLSALAESIAEELRQSDPERRAEFIIQPDVIVEGDPHLLRIVMENLLGNAWKFTSTRELARIEFGTDLGDGERVYFVSDNGVGFDQAYVEKLFTAFQRLHAPTEFPGTGIGLALVKRIIQRHGGRVWAKGELNRGAKFYFSL